MILITTNKPVLTPKKTRYDTPSILTNEYHLQTVSYIYSNLIDFIHFTRFSIFYSFLLQQTLFNFLYVNRVVQLMEAFENFAAGFGVDGEAGAVVFGEEIYFVEVMEEVEI